MSKLIDTIMIIVDLALFMYFFNYAMMSTDMTARLISCAAVTMEIFFIRRHFKIIKNAKQINQ